MMCTIQLAMLLSHSLLITNSFVLGFIAQIFVIFGSAYAYEWTQVGGVASLKSLTSPLQ